ncbi:expressed unknown protein [Seminavis robusta]|uniref:Uncharacterized protein n=1 Tax=Seminavis robusta TaxID=568900 RepID=A0A9N8DT40_9STRA|nr:expressed unknown protein [Seminavis robusta]|eukprot:Sro262_g101940.1 n/a (450) ;mRNA; r:10922-12361
MTKLYTFLLGTLIAALQVSSSRASTLRNKAPAPYRKQFKQSGEQVDFLAFGWMVGGVAVLPEPSQEHCPDEWNALVVCLITDCPNFLPSCETVKSYDLKDTPKAVTCSDISSSLCEQFPKGSECCMSKCLDTLQDVATCLLEKEYGQSGLGECEAVMPCPPPGALELADSVTEDVGTIVPTLSESIDASFVAAGTTETMTPTSDDTPAFSTAATATTTVSTTLAPTDPFLDASKQIFDKLEKKLEKPPENKQFVYFDASAITIGGVAIAAESAEESCPNEWYGFVECVLSDCLYFSDGIVCPDVSMAAVDVKPPETTITCNDIESSLCEQYPKEESACCMHLCLDALQAIATCVLEEVYDQKEELECGDVVMCIEEESAATSFPTDGGTIGGTVAWTAEATQTGTALPTEVATGVPTEVETVVPTEVASEASTSDADSDSVATISRGGS